MVPAKQHCTTFSPSDADKDFATEMINYLFGFYYKPTTEQMVQQTMTDLKKLATNDTQSLSKTFINAGLFETEELILLNNIDNRLHFIGPYTACLRCLLMNL